jgi:Uma2 family endonuclease
MTLMVLDARDVERLKSEREVSGADRFDEVWEGVYMMAPLADDEHQDLQMLLGAVFTVAVTWAGLGRARAGVNVSDREVGWTSNYRIPDVAVFLNETAARNCGTHWVGGPDFGIEIVSQYDRSRDKLEFYAAGGAREMMFVDRDPWALELYRSSHGKLELVGHSLPSEQSQSLASTVLPLSFRLLPATPRPTIEVTHHDGVQRWLV